MSLREKFTGTGIAIITPFHSDGRMIGIIFVSLLIFGLMAGLNI
jgi:hypothetical protein